MCKEHKMKDHLLNIGLQKQDNNCNFIHIAAITQGSKILSIGVNDGKRTKYGKLLKCCIHAEMVALEKLKKIVKLNPHKYKFNKMDVWVIGIIKFKDSYRIRRSEPCIECFNELNKYDWKRLFYSTSEGNIFKTKFTEYSTVYRTPSSKNFNKKY